MMQAMPLLETTSPLEISAKKGVRLDRSGLVSSTPTRQNTTEAVSATATTVWNQPAVLTPFTFM